MHHMAARAAAFAKEKLLTRPYLFRWRTSESGKVHGVNPSRQPSYIACRQRREGRHAAGGALSNDVLDLRSRPLAQIRIVVQSRRSLPARAAGPVTGGAVGFEGLLLRWAVQLGSCWAWARTEYGECHEASGQEATSDFFHCLQSPKLRLTFRLDPPPPDPNPSPVCLAGACRGLPALC